MAAMRRGGFTRAPSPFGYVPLADGPIERRHPGFRLGHDRFGPDLLLGWLEGDFVALSPVHVGTGGIERTVHVQSALAAETPLLVPVARAGGVPVLPGATLKGALRSVVEAIAATCVSVRGRNTIVPIPQQACRRRDELCLGCRLFGAEGYQGRLRCGDARLAGGDTVLVRAPSLHPLRPNAGRMAPGRKFYHHGRPTPGALPLEACPEGARFRWRLDFANLLPAELGLLLVALGQGDPPLWLKLGGFKPACLGSVQFELARLVTQDPATRYLHYDVPPKGAEDAPPNEVQSPASAAAAPSDLAPYFEALDASGLLARDRLEQLAAIVRYPRDADCPGGGY
jgi:CRISPR/Cas system CSM-associated protein Csm3 (group 7 of RAMP superfamily)